MNLYMIGMQILILLIIDLERVMALNTLIDNLPAPPSLTTLDEDFESGLSLWVESGDPEWQIITPAREEDVPNHPSTNHVLHASDCDTDCIITLNGVVDLTSSSSFC